jgi:OOP family OmpA-OmpF porin
MSQIEELRQILIGENSEQLSELRQRVENVEQRTADVAEVLPPAIDAGLKQSSKLVEALKEPVSRGLKEAIRTEPAAYAEILYPVMAPSIRRAIAQAISSLLVTINRTMESATSVRGISMRIQSIRTGVPYAELALRRSLLFKVEHVYLIDRDSGLLIAEEASPDAQSLDSDAVSAMFSAIQSFVQDSFSQNESARLTDLKVGEHNVWVAHGPKIMLACVIFGDAPESLKTQLYDTLDGIRSNFASEINSYDGDNAPFSGVRRRLLPLLQLQLKEDVDDYNQSARKPLLPLLLTLLVLGALTYYLIDRSTTLSTVEHHLRQAPGIAVTDVHWDGDDIVVEGLRDPDAVLPLRTLKAYGIEEQQLRMQTIPFRSLEVAMELQRFKSELDLPPGVHLGSRNNAIFLYGESPIDWLLEHDIRLHQLAADGRLDIASLSASFETVSDILRANFNASALAAVRMSSIAREEATLVQIGGLMREDHLALLNALFAGNHWVDISTRLLPRTKATADPSSDSSQPVDATN